jgi:hypothetical protein
MSRTEAYREALQQAIEKCSRLDLTARCPVLGFPIPQAGTLTFRAFGRDVVLGVSDFECSDLLTGEPAPLVEKILFLHYLLSTPSVDSSEDPISFREIPGGAFYWNPFVGRTMAPLIGRIGNNLDLLRDKLMQFDSKPVDIGDCGAAIHAFGRVWVTLVYWKGDEEFPASAEILFSPCVKQIYGAEDAAVLAERVCRRIWMG